MYPDEITESDKFAILPDELTRGGSCIVDSLGDYLAEPVFGKEKIIYADLDLDKIAERNFDFYVVGHYSRPDVFQLKVNEKSRRMRKG
ncbi:putative amidohydrolase [Virgibacillus natechei]|uniref:Amidohydrolase n=1 Tax=Virgibacillus natechei TaxID=1216297 RepID=A0ABS4IK43_9BACI|nr:hypothetical protein [Virgibacillus natechei]MBP1970811.1 putative amidohydrolase [Virgibacillus natechei]UZD12295.1 hypothetical protein OLD84_15400 [Virgibacillus natechei]